MYGQYFANITTTFKIYYVHYFANNNIIGKTSMFSLNNI